MTVVMDDFGYMIFVFVYIILGMSIPCIVLLWKGRDGLMIMIARIRGDTLLRVHWGDGYETLEKAVKIDDDYMFFVKPRRLKATIPYLIDPSLFETGKVARRNGVRIIDYRIGSAYPIDDIGSKAIEQCVNYIRSNPDRFQWLSSIEKDNVLMNVLCMPKDKLIQNATKYIRIDSTNINDNAELARIKKMASDQIVEEAKKARIELSQQHVEEGVFAYHIAANAVNNPFTTSIIKRILQEVQTMYEDDKNKQERLLKYALGAAIIFIAGAIAFYIIRSA